VAAVFGGEFGLLLGGGIGRAIGELAGGILGAVFFFQVFLSALAVQMNPAFFAAPLPPTVLAFLRQSRLTCVAVLLAMVMTGFWLSWRDGTSGALLGGYRQATVKEGQTDNRGRPVTAITAVALSPDGGRLMMSGDRDGGLILRQIPDMANPQNLMAQPLHSGWVGSVAFSPDGKRALSAGQDRTVSLWDTSTRQQLLQIKGLTSVVGCAAFAPDGRTIVIGSAWPDVVELPGGGLPAGEVDSVVRLLDAESGKEVQALEGHRDAVRAVAFAPTGRQVLSASDDGTMRSWDVATGLQVHRLKGYRSRVLAVALSPDGRRALSGHEDSSVRLWDLEDEAEVNRFERHRAAVTAVAFAADGRTAVSGSYDGTVYRWDTTTGRQMGICRGKKGISSLAVSGDGLTVLTGCDNGFVQLWSWRSRE
jgi:WD40 repeat protein